MSPIPAAPSRARRSIARARKVPATMKTTPDQLSLPLFDTTALTSSMGLYSGLSFGEPADDLIAETEEDAPAPVVIPARNFRLTGARRLAPDWKTRAADNIAAIRLMRRDRGGGAERHTGRAGAPRALHVLRRGRPRQQPLPPIRPTRPSRRAGKPLGRTSSSSSRRPSSRASPASLNMRISRRNSWSGPSGAHCAAWASPAVACSSPDAGPASSSPSCPKRWRPRRR